MTRRVGRKPKPVPRERRCIYLSRQAQAAVREWKTTEMERSGHKVSFSDALDEMIEIASFYSVDVQAAHRTQPLGTLLNGLHALSIPEHVRVEPNTGRRVRCAVCRAELRIAARRFSGIVKEITAFVLAHQHAAWCRSTVEKLEKSHELDTIHQTDG